MVRGIGRNALELRLHCELQGQISEMAIIAESGEGSMHDSRSLPSKTKRRRRTDARTHALIKGFGEGSLGALVG